MKKIIIQFIIMFTIIAILFKTNDSLKLDIYETSIYFIKNVIPSLFPIMIISIHLKHNVLNKNNNKILFFLLSTVTFSPSNALITNDENIILYSSILNPFYSYFIIKNLLNSYISIKIVLTNFILNNIFVLIRTVKTPLNKMDIPKITLTKIIKQATENIINIFGITIFFCIVKNILVYINIPKTIIIFFDVINGFKLINDINQFKIPLIILLNSFTGLSMLFQIKSINEKISYKFIIKKLILSFFTLILTLIIIYV